MEAKKKSPPHTFPHTFFAIKTSTSAPQQLLATVLSSKTSLRSHTICQIHMVHFVPCLFFLVFSSAGAEFVANKAWGDNATHEARGQVKGMTQSVLSVCDKLPAPLLRGGQSKKKKRGRGWLTSPDSQEDTRVVSKRGKSSGCSRLRRASSAPAQTLSQWTRELLGPIMDSMMWRSWILLALLFLFIYLFISRSQVVAFEKVQSSHEGRLRHCWDSTLTNVNSQFEDKKKRSALGEGNIRREEFVMALHYLGVYGCCMYCIIAGVGHNPRTSKMLAFQETIKTASLFINIASSKGASHCQLSKLIK